MSRVGVSGIREVWLHDYDVIVIAELDLGPELIRYAEEVFLVVDLKHHSVGTLRDIAVGRRLTTSVTDLGPLQALGKIRPYDHVVNKGTPRPLGGKWGNEVGVSPGMLRREFGLDQTICVSGVARVRGPLVGSTAVVVRSS